MLFAALGAGVAVGVMLLEPWGDDGEAATQGDFSMALETADDIQEAAQRLGAFMPDFACTGKWNETRHSGTIDCGAGLTGFECLNFARSGVDVFCSDKQHLPEFPKCSVRKQGRGRYLIRCSGPKTNAACEVRHTEITCQRA